jgi:CRISPR/Cas system-associated endonuclease/helicase Cas3
LTRTELDDFSTVVRDLAGLDSIAQAAGRCNRNGRWPTGRVHIVTMAESVRGDRPRTKECATRSERLAG